MTRTHRRLHRVIWIGLGFLVGLGFVLALGLRPAPASGWIAPAGEVAR